MEREDESRASPRVANACVSLGCSPAEITWKSGIDVLCFGGTKNGMAVGEAILFFDRQLAEDFDCRCQAGQLASKMRFLAAPWIGLIESGAWLRNAAHGNTCARYFAEQIATIPGIQIASPVEANAVFVVATEEILDTLRNRAGSSIPSSAVPLASCSRGTPNATG
jgi:threonine aldolase